MASTDAKHIPVKNAAYRVTFPIFDADGDLVTGATGLDSEVSIDGGTFADCTNEATEIATSSGMYYLDLTAAEMNGDTIAVIVKTSSSGAKTTPIVLYTAARSVNDLAYPTTTGRSIDVSAGGEVGLDWANVGSPTTTLNLSGTTIKTAADVEADTQDIQSRLPAALVSGRIDASVGAMASNTLTAAALASDAVTEMQSGLSILDAVGVRTAVGLASANLDTQLTAIDDYLDTEVAAIKAKTDNLPADPADASDIAALFVTVNGKLDAIDDFLDTEIAAILADTTELADTVLADSVPADGSLGTIKQTLYEIRQFLFEFSISSTTGTSKKADGTTTLETFTTNSATTPTSITRSG